MIDRFFNTFTTVFTWGLIIGAIVLLIVIIVKVNEYIKDKQIKNESKQRMLNGINTIKAEVPRWNRQVKINYLQYLTEEYNKLNEYMNRPVGAGYRRQTVIMANINGEIEWFTIDIEGIVDLYYYVKSSLN